MSFAKAEIKPKFNVFKACRAFLPLSERLANAKRWGKTMTNTATHDILAMCAAFAMVTAIIVGAW